MSETRVRPSIPEAKMDLVKRELDRFKEITNVELVLLVLPDGGSYYFKEGQKKHGPFFHHSSGLSWLYGSINAWNLANDKRNLAVVTAKESIPKIQIVINKTANYWWAYSGYYGHRLAQIEAVGLPAASLPAALAAIAPMMEQAGTFQLTILKD